MQLSTYIYSISERLHEVVQLLLAFADDGKTIPSS